MRPIYQNFTGCPEQEPAKIKTNLLSQLTGAVLWNQSINKMIEDDPWYGKGYMRNAFELSIAYRGLVAKRKSRGVRAPKLR